MNCTVTCKEVVERSYPPEDVASIKNFQKEIWKSL